MNLSLRGGLSEKVRQKPALAVFLVLLMVMLSAGCEGDKPDYPARQPPDGLLSDPAQIEQGQQLFMAKCAHCHGKRDEGRSQRADSLQPPASDFTDAEYRQTDPGYLFWRIETGKTVQPYRGNGSTMPAWGPHFSDRQIWQLVAYLKARAR